MANIIKTQLHPIDDDSKVLYPETSTDQIIGLNEEINSAVNTAVDEKVKTLPQGPKGNDGKDGATGATGPTGATPIITMTGEVSLGQVGVPAVDVVKTQTAPDTFNYNLKFRNIPQGPKGNDGKDGANGSNGSNGAFQLVADCRVTPASITIQKIYLNLVEEGKPFILYEASISSFSGNRVYLINSFDYPLTEGSVITDFEYIAVLQGPSGPTGPTGPTGQAGKDGNGVVSITTIGYTQGTGQYEGYTATNINLDTDEETMPFIVYARNGKDGEGGKQLYVHHISIINGSDDCSISLQIINDSNASINEINRLAIYLMGTGFTTPQTACTAHGVIYHSDLAYWVTGITFINGTSIDVLAFNSTGETIINLSNFDIYDYTVKL